MSKPAVALGLKKNWRQFALLVLVNAFVGGMVGMERSIFPKFADLHFGVASATALLSFITAFGIAKAAANYFAGRLANRWGRRNLLLLGWWLALPVPWMLIYAPHWNWVVLANVLLGLSQGLAWSSTVVMKIDLVGEKNRGLAMGLNEFAGYLAVGLTAFASGAIASRYGVSPYPFYLGVAISVLGLLISWLWIKDTRPHLAHESAQPTTTPPLNQVFWDTTIKNPTLGAVTQAGLINNLNDGMIWGLLPLILLELGFADHHTGAIAAIYPTVWGIGQLFTGRLSDLYSHKRLLVWGMLLQGLAILAIPAATHFVALATLAALLGIGTALVYPTFLVAIAAATPPSQRAESIGVFRLWRDLGYALGAIISGLTADWLGVAQAVWLIGLLTLASAWVVHWRMHA